MLTQTKTSVIETEIRERISAWAEAVRAKDVDGIMRHYAPDCQLFDFCGQLPPIGNEALRAKWAMCIPMFEGEVECEIRDLSVTAGEDVAFCHCLNRMGGVMNGQPFDIWMRGSFGFRKIDGEWLVVHAHCSVPTDMETGASLLNLKP